MFTQPPERKDDAQSDSKQLVQDLNYQQADSLDINIIIDRFPQPQENKESKDNSPALRPYTIEKLDKDVKQVVWILKLEKYCFGISPRIFLGCYALACLGANYWLYQCLQPEDPTAKPRYFNLASQYHHTIIDVITQQTCIDLFNVENESEAGPYDFYCVSKESYEPLNLPEFCINLIKEACSLSHIAFGNGFIHMLMMIVSGKAIVAFYYFWLLTMEYYDLSFDLNSYPPEEKNDLVSVATQCEMTPLLSAPDTKHYQVLDDMSDKSKEIKLSKKQRKEIIEGSQPFFKSNSHGDQNVNKVIFAYSSEPQYIPKSAYK